MHVSTYWVSGRLSRVAEGAGASTNLGDGAQLASGTLGPEFETVCAGFAKVCFLFAIIPPTTLTLCFKKEKKNGYFPTERCLESCGGVRFVCVCAVCREFAVVCVGLCA